MSRIAVVGTLVEDTVRHRDGTVTCGLGGIAYSVAALAALAPERAEIWPVCRVARGLRGRLEQEWGAFPRVRLEGLVDHDGPGPRVYLDYRGSAVGGDRSERLLDPVPALCWAEVREAAAADAVLINCVSGFDLELEAAERLAAEGPPVHLDVHSLALGRTASGDRYPRRPADAQRWIRLAGSLQCNTAEARLVSPVVAATDAAVASALVDPGGRPGVALVTRGAAGAVVASVAGPGASVRVHCLEAPAVSVVDPTGAGDVFGAAFVLARDAGRGPVEAAALAVETASASCMLGGAAALAALPRAGGRGEPRNPGAPDP